MRLKTAEIQSYYCSTVTNSKHLKVISIPFSQVKFIRIHQFSGLCITWSLKKRDLYGMIWKHLYINQQGRLGGAQLMKRLTLDFGSRGDLTVVGWSPASGSTLCLEPAGDSVSPAPPALPHPLSPSLKKNL